MPWTRSIVNRLSSAYFRRVLHQPSLADVHCGFTAMTAATARALVQVGFHESYGVYNDILAKVIALPGTTVAYVAVQAIYGDERSHLRVRDVVRLGGLALRMAVKNRRNAGAGRPALRAHSSTRSRGQPTTDSQQAA